MRYILIFWAVPMGLFWGWYTLSYYDINFGTQFFSRLAHDFVFRVYSHYSGIEAEALPILVAQACIFDTFLIFGILAFRRRKRIAEWWRSRRQINAPGFGREALEAGREPLEG